MIFSKRHLSLHSGIYPCQIAASLPACPGETPQRQLFFHRSVSQKLWLLQIFCEQRGNVEALNIIPLNFQPFLTIFGLTYIESYKQCGKRMQLTFTAWVESLNTRDDGKHIDRVKNMSLYQCMTFPLVAIC